jgi:hypothetical protein
MLLCRAKGRAFQSPGEAAENCVGTVAVRLAQDNETGRVLDQRPTDERLKAT